jgi:hypothetical protein
MLCERRDRLANSEPPSLLKEIDDDLRLGQARGATLLIAIDQLALPGLAPSRAIVDLLNNTFAQIR